MKTLWILMIIVGIGAVVDSRRVWWNGQYIQRRGCNDIGCTYIGCEKGFMGAQNKCYESSCFPGHVTVTVEDGSSVSMKDLQVGDRIKTVSNGQVIYTEVKTFLKRQPTIYSKYLNIKTNTGRSLTLADSHQIFVSSSNSTQTMEPRFAESVRKGDYLFTPGHCTNGLCSSLVIDVEKIVGKGAYVPLTDAGTLVVNDVFASCYDTINHDIAHMLATPARLFPWLLSPWQDNGYSPLVQWGKKLSQMVIPSYHQFQDLQAATFVGMNSEL